VSDESKQNGTGTEQPGGQLRPLAGGLTIGSAVFAAVFRLFRLLPNFSPVGALGLYGGARLPLWQALTLPLAVMVVSDVILHYTAYQAFSMFNFWVYGSMLVNVLLGRLMLRRTESPWKIGGVAVLASVQFFLVTNFSCWIGSPLYPQDIAGLTACYIEGVPFFQNTLLGDLLFSGVLFGLHAALSRTAFPAERVSAARAAS
jgi:hypothetical protein